jgi:hypothetical protein
MSKVEHPEHEIQCAIVGHLRRLGFYPVAVPNGTLIAGSKRQRAMRAGILKREGMVPGFPDIVVYGPDGRVGHIEVKNKGQYQKPHQKAAQADLEAFGHVYAVCRSTGDVDEALAKWGWRDAV